MSEDIRERVRRGDIDALLDPSLPLHLLADGPGAEWWAEGADQCARTVLIEMVPEVPELAGRAALAAWCAEVGALHLHEHQTWGATVAIHAAIAVMLRAGPGPGAKLPLVEAARRLRALLPSAPPEIDGAIDILTRYTGQP